MLLLIFMLNINLTFAGGIEFFQGTWEEALEASKLQDKPIFVDAFTTWCGPCKRMAATVFTEESVGDFYNSNFICMKIDMEKPEGRKFQKKYPVSAYPTLYYIDGNGETIYHTKGARQVKQFIELGRTVLGKTDKSAEFAEKYESGDRDPELIINYVRALNKAGKSSLKISNDYLDSQENLSSDFNLKFIFESTVEADSRIFDLLIEHRSAIEEKESKKAVLTKIQEACKQTSKKALEFESETLHEEAKAKMKAHAPDEADIFAAKVDMFFFKAKKDIKNYLKACDDYAKEAGKNDPKQLNYLAREISGSFPEDKDAMKQAEKFSKKASQKGDSYEYYITYAEVLLANGKNADALTMAKKSLELAEGQDNVKRNIQHLIQKIEKS